MSPDADASAAAVQAGASAGGSGDTTDEETALQCSCLQTAVSPPVNRLVRAPLRAAWGTSHQLSLFLLLHRYCHCPLSTASQKKLEHWNTGTQKKSSSRAHRVLLCVDNVGANSLQLSFSSGWCVKLLCAKRPVSQHGSCWCPWYRVSLPRSLFGVFN